MARKTSQNEQTEKERETTRKRQLAAEAALLLLLFRAFRRDDRKEALARVLLANQAGLRRLARLRLAAELQVRPRALAAAIGLPSKTEQRRALSLAGRVERLFRKTTKAATTPELRKQAEVVAENRLRLIATNETVRIFEEERREFAEEYAEETGKRGTKRWDAVADANLCEECESLAGTEISLDDEFPEGDPPLHPNCRCSVEYIFDT